jgi:hypothetical protein
MGSGLRGWCLRHGWTAWLFPTEGEVEDMAKPDALVTMRLADMTRMHPAQDDSHVCAECGHPVGIYPSGLRALRQWPEMKVICAVCACKRPPREISNVAAADFDVIMQEGRDSVTVGKA